MPVHEGHLVLVLEVADGAQAADQQTGADLASEVHEEAAEGANLDPLLSLDRSLNEREPLVDGEERLLGGVRRHGHDEPVHVLQAPAHEIFVAPRDGVEAPGVDSDSRVRHASKDRHRRLKRQSGGRYASGRRKKVIAV